MRTQRSKIFVSDFETTVYEGQESTDVWAAAIVEIGTEDVSIFHSIDELFDYIISIPCNTVIYFHNLKFDGEFWIHFLLTRTDFKQCFIQPDPDVATGFFTEKKFMRSGEFRYSISDKGQWYSITIKYGTHYIEIRDSLKLLPISVEQMGKSFGTKHRKLSMDYTGYRYPGCQITDEEKAYIANDVLVVKEALEIMFSQGHKSMTIGSCCLQEYKASFIGCDWDAWFPNLYDIPIDKETFGASNIGSYIRQSYHGGWCYLVDGKQGRKFTNGTTADVNSLYPSMMHSESGNRYPVGEPTFWIGNYIPDEAKKHDKYYFVRIKTQFRIRTGYLPCIQIKNSPFYNSTKWLTTSDRQSRIDGKYHSAHIDLDGNIQPCTVILTLTMTDFELIREHYTLYNTEILDGCYFRAEIGIFDEYIDKYKKIKTTSKGAIREIAKLFLNNLYGKAAASTDSSFKVAYLKDDNSLGYKTIVEDKKKPGYIPVGTAITSYARNFTIRAAQKNYYGPNNPGFIYADTDSIHCDLAPDKIKGIIVHDTAFCAWKLESCWDYALFVRQKAYLEHITHENLESLDTRDQYISLKCAGMPELPKELFILSLNPLTKQILCNKEMYEWLLPDWGADALDFLLEKTRTIKDFRVGLSVPGKLAPKHIPGGILLTPTIYTMRKDARII